MQELDDMSLLELLQTSGAIIDELIRRGVARTRNNPIGDYTEWLVCNRLGLERQENNQAAFDAINAQGIRYQIKGRQSEANAVRFSTIRDLDQEGFDFVIAVVFNDDYSVRLAAMFSIDVVPRFAHYQQHVNGFTLTLTNNILEQDDVMDITQQLI